MSTLGEALSTPCRYQDHTLSPAPAAVGHQHHDQQNQTWNARYSHAVPHNNLYYAQCLAGGILSSSIRWIQTPLDAVKCNMQVHPKLYPSLPSGLHRLYSHEGLTGLYRGLGPTVLAYSAQSGTKYCLYERLKDDYSTWLGPENAHKYRKYVYLAAAGTAEACADVLMCPWEMIKVQVQTSADHALPRRFIPALLYIWHRRDYYKWPLGSLGPLWARQLPGTVANFCTFETTVEYIYKNVLTEPKQSYSAPTQLGVTFTAGYVAGVVCTIVSHPADSLVSLQGKPEHANESLYQIAKNVGMRKLMMQGLFPRMAMTGPIIAFQWWTYDSFKTFMGMGTTGGEG